MIAYTRLTDKEADLLTEALSEIPHKIIDSVRSKRKAVIYSKLEAIEYGLDDIERFQTFTVPGTTKLLVIRKSDLPAVKTKELINYIKGVQWEILDTVRHGRNEYAYKDRSGDIHFRIRLLRNERILSTKLEEEE